MSHDCEHRRYDHFPLNPLPTCVDCGKPQARHVGGYLGTTPNVLDRGAHAAPARLDPDRTAEPLTRLVTSTHGDGPTTIATVPGPADTLVDNRTGERTSLMAETWRVETLDESGDSTHPTEAAAFTERDRLVAIGWKSHAVRVVGRDGEEVETWPEVGEAERLARELWRMASQSAEADEESRRERLIAKLRADTARLCRERDEARRERDRVQELNDLKRNMGDLVVEANEERDEVARSLRIMCKTHEQLVTQDERTIRDLTADLAAMTRARNVLRDGIAFAEETPAEVLTARVEMLTKLLEESLGPVDFGHGYAHDNDDVLIAEVRDHLAPSALGARIRAALATPGETQDHGEEGGAHVPASSSTVSSAPQRVPVDCGTTLLDQIGTLESVTYINGLPSTRITVAFVCTEADRRALMLATEQRSRVHIVIRGTR